jgi:hypothetical protein
MRDLVRAEIADRHTAADGYARRSPQPRRAPADRGRRLGRARRRCGPELVPAVAIEAIFAWLHADSPRPDDAAATVGAMIGGIIDAIRRAGTKG